MSNPIQFTPPQPADLSQMLDGYQVHDLVATGGMGAVYRATHIPLDRMVAIKVLPAEFADPSFHEQFQAEARAMAKLNHPNLIAIYDFGNANGLPFIVMEFVAGKSLYYSAYKKAIEEGTAVRLTREICEGLAQAHRNGIVHRDIKPANILLDPDAQAKIGDFGLAASSETPQHASDDVVYGTPGYAAPEIIHNPAAIGKPSDIFAVGVILYELLTGALPDSTNPRPASRIANTDPRLDRIIRKATHVNPSMRYQDAGEMAVELAKLQSSPAPQGARTTGRLNKRSGPVTAHAAKRTGPIGPGAAPSKTTPILTKPKKITGKIAARTSQGYEENSDLSQEVQIARRKRPASYQGPRVETGLQGAAPMQSAATLPPPKSSNWPFVRNLLIIAIMAPLLYVMVKAYQKQKVRNAEALEEFEKEKKRSRNPINQLDQEIFQKPRPKSPSSGGASAGENQKPTVPPPSAPTLPTNPLDQLDSLQNQLAEGDRSRFPDSAVVRGNTIIMPITRAMTWTEANTFASDYGAHLACPSTDAELSWLSENLPSGANEIWIGAGSQGDRRWVWVNGDDWSFDRVPSTDLGNFAVLSSSGAIKSRENAKALPFSIEWNKDGINKGDLANQLKRLQGTLENPTPSWPPGTISFEDRHYLFVQTQRNWNDAQATARSANGHLAVPSTRIEGSYLNTLIPTLLPKGQSLWLGGVRTGLDWQWVTNEPFLNAKWLPQADLDDPKKTAIRFLVGDRSGWDTANAYDARSVDGYLIEWSKDGNSGAELDLTNPAARTKIRSLRQIVSSQLSALNRTHNQALTSNVTSFKGDLNNWFRNLERSDRERLNAQVRSYRDQLTSPKFLPTDIPQESMPPELRRFYQDALTRQERYQTRYNQDLLDLRRRYISKITTEQAKARRVSKEAVVQALQGEIQSLGQSSRAFLQHFNQ